jgi:uncharacterized phage protein gp47/JayE
MQLPLQTFQQFVNNYIAAGQAVNASLTDVSSNSTFLAFAEATADNAQSLQYTAQQVLSVTRLATSVGSDCDSFGQQFGFYRLQPTYASGQVTLSRDSATTLGFAPIGAQVQSADGTLTYQIVLDTTNTAYSPALNGYVLYAGTLSVNVPVQCLTAGVSGNAGQGIISVLATNLEGIDNVTNISAFTNASPNESDASFKSRFVLFIASLYLGTVPAIEYAIQSYNQNLTQYVLDAMDLNGNILPATVTVYIDDGSGYTPSSTVQAVNALLPNVRSAGIAVNVYAATNVPANISGNITFNSGVDANAALAAINAAVPVIVNALPVGTQLTFYSIPAIIYNAAVGQIAALENLTLNGSVVDIGGNPNQVVRLQSFTLDLVA